MSFASIVEQVAERIADAKKQEIIDALIIILEDNVCVEDVADKIADGIDIVEEVATYIMDS